MNPDLINDVYVAGRWRPAHSGAIDTVVNPTTEETIACVVNSTSWPGFGSAASQ